MYSSYNFKSTLSPDQINGPNKILDLEKYNGRVNIIDSPSKNIIFKMAEKIELKNKPTDYREALTGTWEHNTLEQTFFSSENISILQNGMKGNVYRLSGNRYVLPNQNIEHLKIVMRGMYLQYAEHYADNIREQIERLNKLVLDYVVPNLYNEAIAYEKYCRDQSTLVTPLPLPLQHNREYKQLELKPWT